MEFHAWGARLPDLAQPDQAILDLDPGSEATFAEVLQAALWVREALAQQLASTSPERIVLAHGPTHRGRQVTIDDAQNSLGRNTAAPYTLRAHPTRPCRHHYVGRRLRQAASARVI